MTFLWADNMGHCSKYMIIYPYTYD